MVKIVLSLFVMLSAYSLADTPWSESYHSVLSNDLTFMKSVLCDKVVLQYPNRDYQEIVKQFPNHKVTIFGYGSLINASSAARTISNDALITMRPVIAFGLHRIFNYYVGGSTRWVRSLEYDEKAFLNVALTDNYHDWVNGVAIEVDVNDLKNLIKREVGYDLIPVLIMNWEEALRENPFPKVEVAYAFVASRESREGKVYVRDGIYPVQGYLQAVQEGSAVFGNEFLDYFNQTTLLWDQETSISLTR